jgi:uncharacterized coiled-coil protein SlyX
VQGAFKDVVSSFGQLPNIVEGSNNHIAWSRSGLACDISYQIRFVERNHRGNLNPWSLRHAGVYHHHCPSDGLDVFFLLHCTRKSALEDFIASFQHDVAAREEFCQNPTMLHESIVAKSDEWRAYLKWLGEHAAENDLAMVEKPENTEQASSFRRLQRLRHTKDFIITARACCSGNLELLVQLVRIFGRLSLETMVLVTCKLETKSYIQGAGVLEERVRNLTELVSTAQSKAFFLGADLEKVGFTLAEMHRLEAAKLHTQMRDLTQEMKNGQIEVAKVSARVRDLTEEMKSMTEETVNDSTTVKIITFVSSLYLPGSFVAVRHFRSTVEINELIYYVDTFWHELLCV